MEPSRFDASFQVAAYDTSAAGDDQSETEFLNRISDSSRSIRRSMQLLTPPESVSLGEREFYKAIIQFRQAGLDVKARYYVRRSGDYLLYFIASYHSEAEDEALEKMAESISFDDGHPGAAAGPRPLPSSS